MTDRAASPVDSNLSSSPDWLSCSHVIQNDSPIGSPNQLSIPRVIQKGFAIPSPRRNAISDTNYNRTFFQPLLVGDKEQRRAALTNIIQLLESSVNENSSVSIDLIHSHIATIVRLSTECPFPEVRSAFQNFLANIRKNVRTPLLLYFINSITVFSYFSTNSPTLFILL